MNDEFEHAGIFDDLRPEDFETPVETNGGMSTTRDLNQDFDKFVDDHLRALRVAYMASQGNLQPVAHLVTSDTEWNFTPYEGETLGHFVERLHNEARRLGAAWVFISRRTLVGAWQVQEGAEMIDPLDPLSIQAAIEAGAYREGVFYFGQRQGRTRHGIIYIEGDTLGEPIESDSEESVKFFSQILGEA